MEVESSYRGPALHDRLFPPGLRLLKVLQTSKIALPSGDHMFKAPGEHIPLKPHDHLSANELLTSEQPRPPPREFNLTTCCVYLSTVKPFSVLVHKFY